MTKRVMLPFDNYSQKVPRLGKTEESRENEGTMGIDRKFLGFEKPALVAAAEYLCARFADKNMMRLDQGIGVLPGGRAKRRLLELLSDRAEAEQRVLVPPKLVTVGKLPEELYANKKPFASDLVQHLVWAEALRAYPRAEAKNVIRSLP